MTTLEQLAPLLKFLLYAGILLAGGMALAGISLGARLGETEKQVSRWIAGGATTTLVAALAGFTLLLWQLGGFDRSTIEVVLAAPTGLALLLQLAGCLLLLAAQFGSFVLPLRLAGALALFASFGVNGHAPAASTAAGMVAVLHLLAAAWWLASLLLLRSASISLPSPALADLVRYFGKLAIAFIGILVGSGLTLILVLVPLELTAWRTGYGLHLGLKIALACAALAVATYARTRVVPRIVRGEPAAHRVLRRTVTVEIALIGGALAATAWLTTFYSPHECHQIASTANQGDMAALAESDFRSIGTPFTTTHSMVS